MKSVRKIPCPSCKHLVRNSYDCPYYSREAFCPIFAREEAWDNMKFWGGLFLVLASVLAVVLVVFSITPARAHDWFPAACCSGKDCKPLDYTPIKNGAGYLLKDGRRVDQSKVRYDGQQKDDTWFLCESSQKFIYCLFPPPGGV